MNSLKILIRTTLLIFLLITGVKTNGQEIDTSVFFCHENLEIKFLWPVGGDQFVANIRYLETERFPGKEMRLSDMYLLFNKSHIVTDTIYVSSTGRSVNVLNEKTISFTSKYDSKVYKISDGQFQLLSSEKGKNLSSVGSENEYMLGSFNGLEIGYVSEAKNRTLKKSKKNIPKYFYLDKVGQKVFLNSGKEDLRGDQWESFLNKTPFALGDVNLYMDEVYINIPMVGICYILNTKTLKVKTVLLPQDGAESWFLNLDKKTGIHYLIGHLKDESFDIYHVDLNSNTKTLLANVEGFMDLIYNDEILYRKELLEGNKKFYCYYLYSAYLKKGDD